MPWGSYGEMLWQGIYGYDKDTNSHMVFRTGAFCPSIYRSQYNRESPVLIVKENVLQYITEANLTGFVLQPASKEKIVKLDWENWDLQAPEPLVYPSGSMDAEEYITRRKHNEAVAEQIGNLFALIPQKDGLLYCEQERSSAKLVEQSLSGLDIFIDRIFYDFCSEIYVSEKAKDVLSKHYSDLLIFQEVPMFVADENLLLQLEQMTKRKEYKKQREAEMTKNDWQRWFRLKDDARKLIEGFSLLKTESAKSKRKLNINDKLNSANEIYPLEYESWMQEYWSKK
ncbi:hypothetical protein C802_03914 [Phocaeicola sartorii]|uniref:Uncharacterized protein n=2 Tax=Phocaeicola sartorii TaxID=671267 RepID=R9HZ07_9BACT|nr:hypothetical protein C802_03914 [Phocaeicola sartorii]